MHEVAVVHSRGQPLLVEPPRRFVTYERYGGRFNNQIFQLAVAFQVSKRFGLTLVVPYETRKVDWTGMFESREGTLPVWDLATLDDEYDWMLESEYEQLQVLLDALLASATAVCPSPLALTHLCMLPRLCTPAQLRCCALRPPGRERRVVHRRPKGALP